MSEKPFYQKSRWKKIAYCIGIFITLIAGFYSLEWLHDKLSKLVSEWGWNLPNLWAVITIVVAFILVSLLVWFLGSFDIIKRGTNPNYVFLKNREDHLGRMVKNLTTNRSKRIIIYGSVPTTIREAVEDFLKWLKNNPQSKLFICYESEEIAEERITELSDDAYGKDVSKEKEGKKRKIDALKEFKGIIETTLFATPYKNNVHFIELSESLSGYFIIDGNQIFFTPKFQKRSSSTFTLELEKDKKINVLHYIRQDILDYMLSRVDIKNVKHKVIIDELEMIKKE